MSINKASLIGAVATHVGALAVGSALTLAVALRNERSAQRPVCYSPGEMGQAFRDGLFAGEGAQLRLRATYDGAAEELRAATQEVQAAGLAIVGLETSSTATAADSVRARCSAILAESSTVSEGGEKAANAGASE